MKLRHKQIVYHGSKHTLDEIPCTNNQSFGQSIYFSKEHIYTYDVQTRNLYLKDNYSNPDTLNFIMK